MSKVAHIIGNGDQVAMYKPAKGLHIACNQPPFHLDFYTSCIVDFKMCAALTEGSVQIQYDWTLGFRPKTWYDQNHGNFKMRFGHKIKEFYTVLPPYARMPGEKDQIGQGYTNFNCGHMAAHYTANKLKCDEIHMYGFDSLFDMNLRSYTDFVLNSDRGATNNVRLNDRWRAIWQGIFNEFQNVQWVLYHPHNQIKFPIGKNVEIRTKNS